MPIQVTCPGCLKRFTVADKHAGKEGPCPSCKKPITIPKLEEKVVIHEQVEGPVDSKGQSVLKTSRRGDSKFQPLVAGIAGGAVLLALIAAYVIGQTEHKNNLFVLGIGAALLGPTIARGGYMFLRDDELEPYRGAPLWIRAGACGLLFTAAWFLFGFLLGRFATPEQIDNGVDMWTLLIPLVAMSLLGLAAAYISLDLEPASGIMLFALFFIATGLLRLVMGLPMIPGLVLGGS
ncbi:MAG: hypothetical protein ACR2NU_14120 [Aeoliella sp.]